LSTIAVTIEREIIDHLIGATVIEAFAGSFTRATWGAAEQSAMESGLPRAMGWLY
jgi:hypothetical protein